MKYLDTVKSAIEDKITYCNGNPNTGIWYVGHSIIAQEISNKTRTNIGNEIKFVFYSLDSEWYEE